ncbi:GntR family transcriptional regulator [Gordonia rhizosphera]|uniref:Putative GntR family transcriptional regulator n=1 Tax=Gordonia rhizosphera NBRC 16068 TaxID=1108045 RepID=K6V2X5_9ACTN|nr:GntR family transcriptional regulator [Gordonia rhizosphera]GAB90348.1 putative GntR family transcriptional regulator [Gordonia rhizosphera NBRC 16068]
MTKQTANAADEAYRATRARIISGELSGGVLLSEVEVGQELGVSRTPVHEAFLRLASEQLLTLIPRRGAVVNPVAVSESADVLAMRHAIETAAARQVFAAAGPGAEVRAQIEDNLARQGELVAQADVSGFVDADDDFHALVVAASKNPIAVHFYEMLRGRQQRLRNVLLRIDPATLGAAYGDHRHLAECLFSGDEDGYQRTLATHFDRYQGAI